MLTTWHKGIPKETFPTLKEAITSDVVIVGGGIAGISTAYFLSLAGKKVVVLEKNSIDKSVTALTTAFLTADIDTDPSDLCTIFGKRAAREIWNSGAHAIRTIEHIARAERISCDFSWTPVYFFATGEKGYDCLRVEADYIDAFGFQIQDLGNSVLPFKHSGAYILKSQAKFHPLLYLFGLRQAAKARGVLFFEHTKALAFSGDSKVTVITKRGTVRADHLVMATYQPFKNPSRLFAKKGMYQSYVIEIAVPTSMISEGLYMDDHNPYHYLRVDAGVKEDRILLGGEDHRQEIPVDPEKNYLALLQYFEEYFPHIPYRIVRKWNGPILESLDGLPFIGRYDTQFPNRYVATAFSGNGMTYGTLSGEILSSLILGKSHPYHILYDPLRTHITPSGILIKTRDYLEELFNGGAKNIFLKKRRKPK